MPFSASVHLAGENVLVVPGHSQCLHGLPYSKEESQTGSEPSQCLVIDGEVEAGRAPGEPLTMLWVALCPQKPFSPCSGLSASQETLG